MKTETVVLGEHREKTTDPYHSGMEEPSKMDLEVQYLKGILTETFSLAEEIRKKLQPALSKKEVFGTATRKTNGLPELLSEMVEMGNLANSVKDILRDLDTNIVV